MMKKTIAVILVLGMLLGTLALTSCGNSGDIIYSVTKDGEAMYVSGVKNTDIQTATIEATYKGKPVRSIGSNAFANCSSLTTVTIPEGVEYIVFFAFMSCTALTEINIPDSVTQIDKGAFMGCSALTKVTIGNGLTEIGDSAFSRCRALTDVTIGSSVTKIGEYAFGNCVALSNITMGDNLTEVGKSAFENTAVFNDEKNWVDDLLYIGNVLVSAKDPEGELTIKDGTRCIAAEAFLGCQYLTGITIPDSVVGIGDVAFSSCGRLSRVTLGNGITVIGAYAFCSTDLKTIWFPASLKKIGSCALQYNINLTGIAFDGTKAEWEVIEKGADWNDRTGDYSIHCTDGNISK